jgi:hypothetical protein
MASYHVWNNGDYFATEFVEAEWNGFGRPATIQSYRRPLGAITLPLWKAGFVIEEMAESLPTEECKKRYPEKYQQLRQEPLFLCVRAQKG